MSHPKEVRECNGIRTYVFVCLRRFKAHQDLYLPSEMIRAHKTVPEIGHRVYSKRTVQWHVIGSYANDGVEISADRYVVQIITTVAVEQRVDIDSVCLACVVNPATSKYKVDKLGNRFLLEQQFVCNSVERPKRH